MQQCDAPATPFRDARGEKGPSLAGGAGYIWGVSLIKRAALSATRCTGEKMGEERGWPVFNGWQTTGEVRGRVNNVRVVRENARAGSRVRKENARRSDKNRKSAY